ncbi:MAG TPA: sucrase ferredoxin, partial [Acidimicrobiales bacterium]
CGADGMRLYTEVAALGLDGVRVWRTSHTGGHRFAPTALTFPDGRAWAWLDADLVRGIVERSLPAATAAAHDRGSVAIGDPFAQAAESAVFGVEGWGWLDRPRTVTVDATDPDRRLVTVTADPVPDAQPARRTYRVEVVQKGTIPVPDCGHPIDEARKSSPDLVVTGVERVGG